MRKKLLLITTCLLTLSSVQAQSAMDDPRYNRAVLKCFSGQQLPTIQSTNPTLYNNLHLYFTQSFEAQRNDCDKCVVDMEQLLNHDLFNVANYEALRGVNTRTQISFKDGTYTIYLLSQNELASLLGGLSAEALMLSTFPTWANSGNDAADFKQYQESVQSWAVTFPEHYRTLTTNPHLISMRFDEFKNLSADKRAIVLTNPSGYLIID